MKPTLLIVAVLLAGCGKVPKVNTYDNPNLKNEHWVGEFTSNCIGPDGHVIKPDPSGVTVLPSGEIHCTGPAIDRPSHEAQVYAELWRVCKEKHLAYQVSCVTGSGCNGNAWPKNEEPDYFKTPYLVHVNLDDPTAVASKLISVLNGPPNNKEVTDIGLSFDTGKVKP